MMPHLHKDEKGIWHRCYHQCKHWLSPGFIAGFWVASTITFPLEHLQWDHIWPFDYIGDWLDHTGHLQMWIAYIWLILFLIAIAYALFKAIKA